MVAANVPQVATLYGFIINGINPGNIVVRFASEVNGSSVTIKAGSFCETI